MEQNTTIIKGNIIFTGYENEYVFEKIKSGDFYEKELLEKWTTSINENSIVFDIGANLGNHTIYFSKIKNAKAVYSFEPIKKNFDLLKKNCIDNHCTQVSLYNIGLGEKDGQASMQDNATNFGAIELSENAAGDIKICALDNLEIPAPDFVKIDVEGFEVKVLYGMKNTLERAKPNIWVEVRQETFAEVNRFLKEQGYEIIDFNNKFNFLYSATVGEKNIVTQDEIFDRYFKAIIYGENEMWKAKKFESKFLYEQNKANELTELCGKRQSKFLYEQRKRIELKKEVGISQQKIDLLQHEKVHLVKTVERYKASSEKYCSAYQYEQKKCESLKNELEQYKSSKAYKLQHKLWRIKSDTRFYTKKHIYKLAYKIYRIIEPYPPLVRLAYKVNDKLQIVKDKDEARQIYQASRNQATWKHNTPKTKKIKELKIAAILDEFSYNCFKYECNLLVIEPDNWLDIFESEQPDIFLCESAWSGADSKRRPWKGKIYSSINFSKENRTVLLSILSYCQEHSIPTVFWNKEDPSHYDDKVHNFVDTAVKFDHIFTTAEECVERYKGEYGHKSVHALMFATQPKMFNPIEKYNRTDEVIFAGSWYAYHEQRCREMEEIFDKILDSGKKLVIYNRYYGDSDPNHFFPKKYEPYIRPALPFEEIDKAYKGSEIALNITTVTESETMFARRVFELASCNTAIISNYSAGIEKVFGDNIIFTDRELNFSNLEEKKAANLENVLTYHTYANRLEQMLNDIGYVYLPEDRSVSIYYCIENKGELEQAIKNFQNITYINKHLKIIYNDKNLDVNLIRNLETSKVEFYCSSYLEKYNKKTDDASAYVVYANNDLHANFIDRVICHYSYLEDDKYCVQNDFGFKIVDDVTPNTVNWIKKQH